MEAQGFGNSLVEQFSYKNSFATQQLLSFARIMANSRYRRKASSKAGPVYTVVVSACQRGWDTGKYVRSVVFGSGRWGLLETRLLLLLLILLFPPTLLLLSGHQCSYSEFVLSWQLLHGFQQCIQCICGCSFLFYPGLTGKYHHHHYHHHHQHLPICKQNKSIIVIGG